MVHSLRALYARNLPAPVTPCKIAKAPIGFPARRAAVPDATYPMRLPSLNIFASENLPPWIPLRLL